MRVGSEVVKKAAAFVLREDQSGNYQLLICSIASKPHVESRVPGGNLNHNESVEDALIRELVEESGLEEIKIIRKLGVDLYYKEYISSNVERHDFLMLAPKETADYWEHVGTGNDSDSGITFKYKWINSDELTELTSELRTNVTPEKISELFRN